MKAGRPARVYTASLLAFGLAVIVLLALVPSEAQGQRWSDLPPSVLEPYGINEQQVADISEGYSDGTWRPFDNMSRAQFVKMAVERFGLDLIKPATSSFRDVPVTHPHYAYIETAYEAGMIEGVGDGNFDAERSITRREAAAVVVRYMADLRGTTTEDLYGQAEIEAILGPFQESPADMGTALADEMAAAVDWDLLQGTSDGYLLPNYVLRRIQGAAMLIRADIPETRNVQVSLFFARNGVVAPVHRTVTVGPSLEVGAAALQQLLGGPTQAEQDLGVYSSIPAGTGLLGLSIESGVATVDLDKDFTVPASEAARKMSLAQLVYTLTSFRSVGAVHFHVGGETLSSPFGDISLEQPLARPTGYGDSLEDVTPAILVTSPTMFDTIGSAVRVRGTANVFEHVFQLEIRDDVGTLLAEETVMASAGTGTRGTFDVTVPFDPPATGTGRLIVYSYSGQGNPINEIDIPVVFR